MKIYHLLFQNLRIQVSLIMLEIAPKKNEALCSYVLVLDATKHQLQTTIFCAID